VRYYDIAVTPQGSNTPAMHWTSHPNGQQGIADPGAQNVEFDMPVLPYNTPSGGMSLRIEGVSLQQINQSTQLAGMNLTMRGGMAQGLPLATRAANQAGVLVTGQVFQAFGNWIGTDMTLDFVLLPSVYTDDSPGNFILHWPESTPLATALTNMFTTVYPNMPVSIHLGSNLTPAHDCSHTDTTLEGIAAKVYETTTGLFNVKVYITIQSGKILVYDDTYKPAPIPIAFTDMIGQPTWIEANTMQLTTNLRADIQVGSEIQMPQGFQNSAGLIGTQAASMPSSIKYQSAFQNAFQVIALRHVGDFRSSDASAWCTVMNCVTSSAT